MLENNKIIGKISSKQINGKSSIPRSLGQIATKLLGLDFLWDGTKLGIKREGTQDYQFSDLQGPQGNKGDTGLQGIQGEQGVQGPKGDTGSGLEFIWQGTQLGVRVEGTSEYTYVDLKGPQGPQGAQGDKGDNNVYSTSEVQIGTWLDKPLYRKVFDAGYLPDTSSKTITTGFSQITCRKLYGILDSDSSSSMFARPLPYVGTDNICILMKANGDLSVTTNNDLSSYKAYIVVEYTKTID